MNNILILGAEFSNKGAEAMLITLINILEKSHPLNHVIVALDNAHAVNRYRQKVRFKLISFNVNDFFAYKNNWKNKFLNKLSCVIDISGFILSSEFKFIYSIEFINRIRFAKELKIPIYILPQSFGPLEFSKFHEKLFIYLLLKYYMKYPKIVCARENSGYKLLKPYCNMNLVKTQDLVLSYKTEINLDNIYKNKNEDKHNLLKLTTYKNVAIIPNMRNITNGGGYNQLLEIYQKLINFLLHEKRNIYLLAHSNEDRELCNKIKKYYENEKLIYCPNIEMNFVEFEKMIGQFDYAIVSRYHALVHAYKRNIPCLVLSWADKYKELTREFKQNEYLIDTKEQLNVKKLIEKINCLNENYEHEQQIIKESYDKLKNKFDFERLVW